MSIVQRFGICLMIITLYAMLTYLMPEGLVQWKRGAMQLLLTLGMLLFLMFPKDKQEN